MPMLQGEIMCQKYIDLFMFGFDIFVSVFILFGPNIIKKFNFFQTYLFFKAVYTSHTLIDSFQ